MKRVRLLIGLLFLMGVVLSWNSFGSTNSPEPILNSTISFSSTSTQTFLPPTDTPSFTASPSPTQTHTTTPFEKIGELPQEWIAELLHAIQRVSSASYITEGQCTSQTFANYQTCVTAVNFCPFKENCNISIAIFPKDAHPSFLQNENTLIGGEWVLAVFPHIIASEDFIFLNDEMALNLYWCIQGKKVQDVENASIPGGPSPLALWPTTQTVANHLMIEYGFIQINLKESSLSRIAECSN